MRSFNLVSVRLAIHARVFGSSSVNVAIGDGKLGATHHKRAKKAHDANELIANIWLAGLTEPK